MSDCRKRQLPLKLMAMFKFPGRTWASCFNLITNSSKAEELKFSPDVNEFNRRLFVYLRSAFWRRLIIKTKPEKKPSTLQIFVCCFIQTMFGSSSQSGRELLFTRRLNMIECFIHDRNSDDFLILSNNESHDKQSAADGWKTRWNYCKQISNFSFQQTAQQGTKC